MIFAEFFYSHAGQRPLGGLCISSQPCDLAACWLIQRPNPIRSASSLSINKEKAGVGDEKMEV
jgi:hypothetical protein